MPPKVKDLVKKLKKAGFTNRGGKGSHRNFEHGKGVRITISGKDSADAKHYQIKQTEAAIQETEE